METYVCKKGEIRIVKLKALNSISGSIRFRSREFMNE
jgi:hypothetical protein